MSCRDSVRAYAFVLALMPVAAYSETITNTATAPWESFLPDILRAAAVLIAVATGATIAWQAFGGATPEGFGVRRHAGGFGGVGIGWRVSAPLARLAAGLALVAFGVMLGYARVPVGTHTETPKTPDTAAKVSPEKIPPTVPAGAGDSKDAATDARSQPGSTRTAPKAESAASGK